MLANQKNHPRRQFTVDEVIRMVQVGILREDEPLELLEGELVVMSPQGMAHYYVINTLRKLLLSTFDEGYIVGDEKPLRLDERSMPEPDLSVVRGDLVTLVREDRLPRGDEAVLVVEVAHSTQSWDRRKARLYARAGVPVYWLVDLVARRVEVYQDPGEDGRYRSVRLVGEDGDLEVPGGVQRWPVAELFPPRERS